MVKSFVSLFIRRVNITTIPLMWGCGGIQFFRCPWLTFLTYDWDVTGKWEGLNWMKPWAMDCWDIYPAPPEQINKTFLP